MSEYVKLAFDPHFIPKLNSNPDLICFTNGVRNLKLTYFVMVVQQIISPLVQISNMSQTIKIPADFDTFPKKIQPNNNLLDFVMLLFSSCLSGTSIHHLYVLCGSNAIKLVELLMHTLGDYAQSFDVGLFASKTIFYGMTVYQYQGFVHVSLIIHHPIKKSMLPWRNNLSARIIVCRRSHLLVSRFVPKHSSNHFYYVVTYPI